MGFWSSMSALSLLNESDELRRLVDDLASHYSATTLSLEFLSRNSDFINKASDFINKAKAKYPNIQYQSLFDALIYAYESRGFKYPDTFDIHLAMEYLEKLNARKEEPKAKISTSPQWFKQKSDDVENHLKHIALMKLQLTKNLKDLQNQNGGHLWIDTDFIEPATETLQASLEQIQDLESRLQVLQATYQDHL